MNEEKQKKNGVSKAVVVVIIVLIIIGIIYALNKNGSESVYTSTQAVISNDNTTERTSESFGGESISEADSSSVESTEASTADLSQTELSSTDIESTESPQYPVLVEKVTKALTDMMYESFGGSGNDEFATSWYKYIDYWEVYQNEDSTYSVSLYLKERPYDYSSRVLLSQYYSDDELDTLCPTLMDVGASLGLDDTDLCLIGEDLYKISISEDSETCYSSLAALNIPVYDFLSSGSGWSVKEVKSAIKKNQIPGSDAYQCLIDYMSYTYKGAFDGLSMEIVKNMSMAAISNFDDVQIETLTVYDQDNKSMNTYEKPN